MADKPLGRPPGGPKFGGRAKGTTNKITATLKEAILLAGQAAHPDGMVGYLTKQAAEQPAAFMTLLGKVLPLQIAGDSESPLYVAHVHRTYVTPTDENG